MVKIRFSAILCLAVLACFVASSQSGPRKLSSFDPQANALLAKMTLDEKVGQMTQPDHSSSNPIRTSPNIFWAPC